MEPKTVADFEEDGQLNMEQIVETYNGYLYTILKNCMTSSQDMEEVLSDIFVILWKNQEKIDKNMLVKPYLVGIAKNLIRKKYRTLNLADHFENWEDYDDQIMDQMNLENLVEQNEKSQIIQNAIDEMKEQEAQIFVMFYYQSRKVKEISAELGITKNKVKVTLYRLRKFVRKKLKKRGYDYGKSRMES